MIYVKAFNKWIGPACKTDAYFTKAGNSVRKETTVYIFASRDKAINQAQSTYAGMPFKVLDVNQAYVDDYNTQRII